MSNKTTALIVSLIFLAVWLIVIWFQFEYAILVAALVGAWNIGSYAFKLGDWLVEKFVK